MAKAKIGKKFTKLKAVQFRKDLLEWYDVHARILPWRYTKDQKPDPYRVWLSEIMLQQTTVAAVEPYFVKFTEKWPTVNSLARAPQESIMTEWAGLGYYSRARNLHKCAGIVANELQGRFPDDQNELKKLPGIGDYTSAAIRAIAFNKPAIVVDGNVERIMARYFAWQTPMPEAKKDLKDLAADLFEDYQERPGDLAQALMDLGATICIPKTPRCALCPVRKSCEGRQQNIAALLPRQSPKKAKAKRFGHVYWITNDKGQILLERRESKGLLGGMMGLPTSEWAIASNKISKLPKGLENILTVDVADKLTSVHHVFTHFDLELRLQRGKVKKMPIGENYYWEHTGNLEQAGFPTVFRKAVQIFIQNTRVS
jgi:A/G-specific adenine glycosylase